MKFCSVKILAILALAGLAVAVAEWLVDLVEPSDARCDGSR